MTIEHKNIVDPNIHEPKGISSAPAGTMYASNGLGGGSWEYSSMNVHGSISMTHNTVATAVPAATDPTLHTDSDYRKITTNWGNAHVHNVGFVSDKLEILVAGHYEVSMWMSVKVPSINNFIGVKYALNDTPPYSAQKVIAQSVTAGDYKNLSAKGSVDLAAGTFVSLYIAGTKADNLVVEEAGLSIVLLHEV